MADKTLEMELTRILEQIHQDRFGGRDAPFVELLPDTGFGPDGALRGGFEIQITRRNGDVAVLHKQSLEGITDLSGLKDAFSEALSQVLADHSAWPR